MTHPLFLHCNCVEPLADGTINHREFFRLLMASRSSRPIALAPMTATARSSCPRTSAASVRSLKRFPDNPTNIPHEE